MNEKSNDGAEPASTPAMIDDRPCAGFDEFVHGQIRALIRFLRRRNSIEDAEDIAQESIISLLGYRDKGQVADWRPLLYRIAINHSIKRAKREAPYRNGGDGIDIEAVIDGAPLPDEEAERVQRIERLQIAIMRLPPKCRRVYLLRHGHGMSHARIAEQCGISIKMVEKHLANALLHLQRQVGPLREGGM